MTPVYDAAAEVTRLERELDVLRIYPTSAQSDIVDWPNENADMNGGTRLDVRDPAAGGEARFLFVLAPANAVAAAAPLGGGSEIGVSLDFAGGAHAEIVFDRDVVGATVQYLGAGSTLLFDGALTAGVDELPLLATP